MGNFDMLVAKDLYKTYRTGIKEVRAVNGISLEITKGRSIAIVGPSGAGKSTLLHMLGGLDKPSSGKVLMDDLDIYRLLDKDRATIRNKRIGFVFQFYHLLPEFTALENVALPVLMKSGDIRYKAELCSASPKGTIYDIRRKAADVLKSVGLGHRLDHLPSRLSGGECQRVAISRALVNEPDLLLCDEPTGNLDSKTSESIYDLLFNIKSRINATLVIVSHDDKLAAKVDDTIRLRDGKIV